MRRAEYRLRQRRISRCESPSVVMRSRLSPATPPHPKSPQRSDPTRICGPTPTIGRRDLTSTSTQAPTGKVDRVLVGGWPARSGTIGRPNCSDARRCDSSHAAGLVVLNGLDEFRTAIHHEWAVPRHWLA